jgi:hypothetical protein
MPAPFVPSPLRFPSPLRPFRLCARLLRPPPRRPFQVAAARFLSPPHLQPIRRFLRRRPSKLTTDDLRPNLASYCYVLTAASPAHTVTQPTLQPCSTHPLVTRYLPSFGPHPVQCHSSFPTQCPHCSSVQLQSFGYQYVSRSVLWLGIDRLRQIRLSPGYFATALCPPHPLNRQTED